MELIENNLKYYAIKHYTESILGFKIHEVDQAVVDEAYYIDFTTVDGYAGLFIPMRGDTGIVEKYMITIDDRIIANLSKEEFDIIKPMGKSDPEIVLQHLYKTIFQLRSEIPESNFIEFGEDLIVRLNGIFTEDICMDVKCYTTINGYSIRLIVCSN